MKYKINLLSQKEKNLSDKIIYFGLHYLRYILVITQLVVISVFFYRFKIDQEIIDLKDELQQKQEIVLVSDPLLQEAKATDMKMKEIKEITDNQNQFSQILSYFFTIFPEKMTVKNLKMATNSIEFEAQTDDPGVIRMLSERLKKDKKFKSIDFGSIKKSEAGFSSPFKLSDFTLK